MLYKSTVVVFWPPYKYSKTAAAGTESVFNLMIITYVLVRNVKKIAFGNKEHITD